MRALRCAVGLALVLAGLAFLPAVGPSADPVPAASAATRRFGSSPVDDVLYWADQKKACGLTRDQLAAMTMVPAFTETQAPTSTTPSPMTLSRYDNQSSLYAFGSPGLANKAFFHPGVSAWQFDSAGGWPLSAFTAINTYTASATLTGFLSQRYCQSSGSSSARRAYAWFPWSYCSTTSRCESLYLELLDGFGNLSVNRDDAVGSLGGMESRTCEVSGVGTVPCGYVDPSKAQGLATWNQPGFGLSPITAPFYVFEAGGREYRYWLKADTGYSQTIRASKAVTANARTSLTWSYSDTLCDRTRNRGACTVTGPYITWSSWSSIGVSSSSSPTVVANADGRLEWFMVADNTVLYHAWQTTPGGGWSAPEGLTGYLPPTTPVTVGRNPDGRLEVFLVAADGKLWHNWQVAPNSGWWGWQPLGGSWDLSSRLAVGNNADGRLEVFLRGKDQSVWHIWQVVPNGGWGDFVTMNGGFAGPPVAATNADGRQEVFAVGNGGGVWRSIQGVPNGLWSDWVYVGGPVRATSPLAAGRNQDGRLELFGVGTDNALWHMWQTGPGAGYTGWYSLGGNTSRGLGLSMTSDSRFEMFAVAGDGTLSSIWQQTPNSAWGAWSVVGGAATSAPAPARDTSGLQQAFAVASDKRLGRFFQYVVP